jgi:carboxyl-terminal processing protease
MDEQGHNQGQGEGQGQPPEYPPVQPQPPQYPPGPQGPFPPAGPPHVGSYGAKQGMSRNSKIILTVVVVFVVLAGLLGAAFVVDRVVFPAKKAEEFDLEASPVFQDTLFDIKQYFYRDFSEKKITTAANLAVKKQEKKGVTDHDKLLDVGLTALVKALGDEHSGYLTSSENKRLTQDLSGSFYGVGFTLRKDKKTDRPQVVTVIKGSPSDKAGVKPDDIIMSVDGEDTKGQSLEAVVLRIRGEKGTKVKIKAKRKSKTLDFNITRQKIDIPDFESEIVDGNIGVLKLFEFNEGVSEKVRTAVRGMQQKGVKGFILDLRNNPGGLLDEAVKVSSIFINDGRIVSYQVKGQRNVDENASGDSETTLPLVALVNKGSASASEITAGALQDRGRAVLVGSKTYGKGSVQKVFQLSNDGATKLTVALYYLPNGESIDGKGIQPDVPVEEVKDDRAKTEQLQFDKAKEVLNNLIQGKPATGEILLLAA